MSELMQEAKGHPEEEGEELVAVATATTTTGEDESSTRLQTRREGKQQQLELSLGGGGGREEEEEEEELGQEAAVPAAVERVEKEHMFEKVVTPSDVGKLNRLVIPKQHAEKYFPLDSSSNEKGLLLNFEDRTGKHWRFRYSYWNSSQSYVMTKGWSRFVKDKKLEAGDVVSFHRGVGDLHRHRLYIDWRPRSSSHTHHPLMNSIFSIPNNYFLPINPRTPFTSNPHPYPPSYPHHHHFHPQHSIYDNNYYTLHQHQQYPHPPFDHNYYLTSPIPQQQQEAIIDSVPIAHHHHHTLITAPAPAPTAAVTPTTTPRKRMMRLFGVNMECATSSSTPTFGDDPRGEENLTSQYPPHSSAQ